MSQGEKDSGGLYAEVGIPLPVEKTFHYVIPPSQQSICAVGKRVLVPLGKRKTTGYVLEISSHLPTGIKGKDIKEIIDCLDKVPLFDAGMLQFLRWTAAYYLAPLGQVIKTALPPGINWESYYHVSLTPEGEKAVLECSPRGEPSIEIIRAIDRRTGSPLKKLLKQHSYRSSFFTLQNKGLIRLEERISPGRTKIKKTAFVEPITTATSGEHTTSGEQAIIAFLEEEGAIARGELRKRFRNSSAILNRLIAKGMLRVRAEEVYRETAVTLEREEGLFALTAEQEAAVEQIGQSLEDNTFSPFLLHGVTGSGKTEVYIRAVQKAISLGKRVLILVPEIALTPQLVGRFQKRIPVEIALLHSGLSPGERYDQWRKIARGEVQIVIGARSAVFAPCQSLGLIIADDEHDPSYKQEEGVKYNARDLAVVRAQRVGAVVLFGSATPSFESFYNARQGKFRYLHLPRRVEAGILPAVEVVDLKGIKHAHLSSPLRKALADNLKRGGQSLLFLNRRGFSHAAMCADCGAAFKCPRCSVSLTFHARDRLLLCHYCGYRLPALQICSRCGGGKIRLLGYGTEKVEEEVKQLFPEARVARMDSDVMTRGGAYGRLLQSLERGEIDILVGTQMIVKGHDFPQITLVGIVAADITINLPELRAAERCFQLLSQAAGKAGRGSHAGKVIIQTFLPDHYVIQRAKDHDFAGFYEEEMAFRRTLRYPPLTRMINIRVSSRNPRDAEKGIRHLAKKAEASLKTLGGGVDILGPSAAPLYQIKGRYRWQLLLKGERMSSLQSLCRSLIQEGKIFKALTIEADVDPLSML